jgi:hypothetical protein
MKECPKCQKKGLIAYIKKIQYCPYCDIYIYPDGKITKETLKTGLMNYD